MLMPSRPRAPAALLSSVAKPSALLPTVHLPPPFSICLCLLSGVSLTWFPPGPVVPRLAAHPRTCVL